MYFPWLDPARAIIDSVIFFLPTVNILVWRLWVALISIIILSAAAYIIVRRSSKIHAWTPVRNRIMITLLTIYGVLFLFQGPIYAHLLVAVLPILIFYDHDRPKVTIFLIALCSLWSGLTRVNWFFMPTIIAAIYYILSQSKKTSTLWNYFFWPGIWGLVNLAISIPVYFWSLHKAGQPSFLNPDLDYGFFTSKLWPNNGYSPGLIAGILITLTPLLILILRFVWINRRAIHPSRVASLLIILAILASGSTLISLRTGGGYDLHNYDTCLLVIFILGIRMGMQDVQPDKDLQMTSPMLVNPYIISSLLIVPLLFSIWSVKPKTPFDRKAAGDAIYNVNLAIKENAITSGERVLFIDHRALVIFGETPPLSIFSAYEKIELMEMAMAQNTKYFQQFDEDLKLHKFDVLITPFLWEWQYKTGENPFWYESNSWSTYVVAPILQYYEPVYSNREADLAIYYPK